MSDKTIKIDGGRIYIKDSSLNGSTSNISFEANYELADASKTTSQGTPFSPYPDINDYSYMLWKDTDNELVSVPQGASIFYPVNYAGTLDDLVAYVDGDVTNLAKKSDITDTALNERGYYKMQDLSANVTLNNGLSTTVKKCYKTGNVVTLDIEFQNNSGSQISAGTSFATLTGSVKPPYGKVVVGTVGTTMSIFTLTNDGDIISSVAIPTNNYVYFCISYIIA